MAEFTNRFFGEMSGSFGDVVYRQRNGKNYTAKKPKQYTVPNSDKFKKRTFTFKLSLSISKIINQIPELKNIWKSNVAKGVTPYQHLISLNYPFLNADSFSSRIKIAPNNGFGVRIDQCSLTDTELSLSLNPLSAASNINTAAETKIQLFAVVYLNNPVNEGDPQYAFFSVTSEKITFDLTNPLSFTVIVPTSAADELSAYKNSKIFFTLVTFDEADNPVNYANTFSYLSK